MNAQAATTLTEAQLAELREQHAFRPCTFMGVSFEAVMADPVLRRCLQRMVAASKRLTEQAR